MARLFGPELGRGCHNGCGLDNSGADLPFSIHTKGLTLKVNMNFKFITMIFSPKKKKSHNESVVIQVAKK